MAVPRNRSSNARKNARRSHHAKRPKQFVVCDCGRYRLPHCICMACGRYQQRAVLRRSDAE